MPPQGRREAEARHGQHQTGEGEAEAVWRSLERDVRLRKGPVNFFSGKGALLVPWWHWQFYPSSICPRGKARSRGCGASFGGGGCGASFGRGAAGHHLSRAGGCGASFGGGAAVGGECLARAGPRWGSKPISSGGSGTAHNLIDATNGKKLCCAAPTNGGKVFTRSCWDQS